MRGPLAIFRLWEYLVHIRSIGFFRTVLNRSHANAKRARAEPNLDNVTELNVVRSLRHTTVNGNVGRIARIVRNRSALNDARHLQILIEPHGAVPNLSR